MLKHLIRIIFISTAFITASELCAMPHVTSMGPSEYRAANINWAAAEDDHGFTYFGNDMGLLEFDGMRWRHYRLPRAAVVRAVAVLSHQTIFTGSFEEFGRWDRDKSGQLQYTSLIPDEETQRPRNCDFWRIFISEQGVLFQSFHNIYFYDYKRVHKLDTQMNMLFLLQAGDEHWVQQMGGPLYKFVDGEMAKIVGSEIFSTTTVRILLPLPGKDRYLVGTGTMGVWLYQNGSFTEWNRDFSRHMKRDELNCGVATSRGTYLFGTLLGGIYETDVNGYVKQHLSADNVLDNNSIMSLLEERSGNVWALTDRGLAYLSYNEHVDYYTNPNWPFGSVYDAVVWRDKLFLATNQGVFYSAINQLTNNNISTRFQRVANIQGQVWSLSVIDDRLWCCHNIGLLEIGSDLKGRHADLMGGYHLTPAQINGRDVMFYASYYQLRMLDISSGKVTKIEQLGDSYYDVEVDHMQNVWLEHPAKGVYKCRINDDMQTIRDVKFYGGGSGDGLPYKLQVFRVGGRAVMMGDDSFFTYNDIQDRVEPDSLLNACFNGVRGIRRIIPSGQNRFWAITTNGVYELKNDGYNASLVPCDGIPSDNMVYGYENVAVLNDSTSLFCCDNGFIVHHRHNHETTIPQPAAPSIEAIRAVDDEQKSLYFAATEDICIPFSNNALLLRFAAMRSFPDNLSFRYRLQGVDADWIVGNTTGEAHYARLPKGKYTFEVVSEDRYGNISKPTLTQIEILSPWYTSIWAYVGYTLLMMLMLYATWLAIMYRYRRNYLRKLRHREIIALRTTNKSLTQELEIRDAEIFSQSSMLIAKNELIHRIREMVEDFTHKQGNKSLTPLYYKINTFISGNIDTDNDWKLFLIRFEQKHAGFFRILKDRYPDLTSSDLRMCACLKLQLDSKEIASLMNLSVRAVENSRYRLRKRLGLQQSQNLNDFLMEIDPEVVTQYNNEAKIDE